MKNLYKCVGVFNNIYTHIGVAVHIYLCMFVKNIFSSKKNFLLYFPLLILFYWYCLQGLLSAIEHGTNGIEQFKYELIEFSCLSICDGEM